MSRWAKFCGWLLKKMGWTTVGGPAPEDKCVILGVPHTSVWDFVVSYLFYTQFDRTAHVMIKKEFFFWPVGVFLRKVGCIPVDRRSAAAMVKSLIEEMEKVDQFHLAIAPEGTRKAVKNGRLATTSSQERSDALSIWVFLTGRPSASASARRLS